MLGRLICITIGLAMTAGVGPAAGHTDDGLTATARAGSVKTTDSGVEVSGKLTVAAPGGDPNMYGAKCTLIVSVKNAGSRRLLAYVQVAANQRDTERWKATIKDADGSAASKGTVRIKHCHQDIINF